MTEIGFQALIKDVHSRSLVSGDKETRVVLAFQSTNALEVLNALNELHRADVYVEVGIVALPENNRLNQNEVPKGSKRKSQGKT